MATISKNWGAETFIEGSATPTWTTLSGTTEEFSSDVDLETNGYEGAHVFVEVDFDLTPTDNVKVKVYGSSDGINYDDTPLYEFTIDKGTDPHQVSFIVKDLLHFRLGFQQDGATDSHNVRAWYQAWGWASA